MILVNIQMKLCDPTFKAHMARTYLMSWYPSHAVWRRPYRLNGKSLFARAVAVRTTFEQTLSQAERSADSSLFLGFVPVLYQSHLRLLIDELFIKDTSARPPPLGLWPVGWSGRVRAIDEQLESSHSWFPCVSIATGHTYEYLCVTYQNADPPVKDPFANKVLAMIFEPLHIEQYFREQSAVCITRRLKWVDSRLNLSIDQNKCDKCSSHIGRRTSRKEPEEVREPEILHERRSITRSNAFPKHMNLVRLEGGFF